MDIPWTEKYRPKKLREMVGQDAIVERLEAYVKSRSIPQLCFAGPAGTGKTTAAICIARELFGDDFTHDFLELNASDERGVDIMRSKDQQKDKSATSLKDFARMKPIVGEFKIVFLDEADALTPEAQGALRRTMEKYTQNCRFILSCNYSSKIIEPIQSRCAMFRFRKIPREAIKKYLEKILHHEKVQFDDAGLEAILYVTEGDLRQSINILQGAAALGKVDEEHVYAITTRARPKDVQDVLRLATEGKFLDARNLLDKLMVTYGLSGEDIIVQMSKEAMNLSADDKTKVRIIDLIGESNFTIVEGANERIQLEALLARIALLK
ncbi:MAG: replication factor C small subunit [Candidatus Altiarchaeota archaeon]|nr:replication factor C small subunit [Candidatus Altiarchaeota archaeon]